MKNNFAEKHNGIFYTRSLYPRSPYTLVFVHGLGGDQNAWKLIRKFFDKQKISNIAIDIRGHGKSSRTRDRKAYTVPQLSQDITNILKINRQKNYILIGHCFGGLLALFALYKHADVKALVLLNSGHESPAVSKKLIFLKPILHVMGIISVYLPYPEMARHREFQKYEGKSDYYLPRLTSDIIACGPNSYIWCLMHLFGLNLKLLLPKIKIPVLVISGASDTIYTHDMGLATKKLLSNSQMTKIKDGRHLMLLDYPNKISNIIYSFIQKV